MMMMYLLIGYFIFSWGIFVKLKHYGAPNSSFLYAGLLPLITLLCMVSICIDASREKNESAFRLFINVIKEVVFSINHIALFTGVVCLFFGEKGIGLEHLLGFKTVKRSSFYELKKQINTFFEKIMINANTSNQGGILRY